MEHYFGQKGIWHMPESDDHDARDIEAVVLEQTKEGVLYIFTTEPIRRGYDNLSYRTATIFPSDFTPDTTELVEWCGHGLKKNWRLCANCIIRNIEK